MKTIPQLKEKLAAAETLAESYRGTSDFKKKVKIVAEIKQAIAYLETKPDRVYMQVQLRELIAAASFGTKNYRPTGMIKKQIDLLTYILD